MHLKKAIRHLRFQLAYIALRGALSLLRCMPLDSAGAFAAWLGRVTGPRMNPKRHRLALANLAVAYPNKSAAEREAICLAHWEHLGRVVLETAQIGRILSDPARLKFSDQKVLDRYEGKLGPAIGISLHMGNWEMAIWPLTANGINPGALYRTLENPYIDRFIRKEREQLYPGGMFSRGSADKEDDFATARAMMEFVRRGGRLGMLCDQFYRDGISVRLFGRETKAQPMGAIIARRLGVRIWMARCVRVENRCCFRIDLKELRVPRTANQVDDIKAILQAMYDQFEAWVDEAPEQWIWSNRKWPRGIIGAAPETSAVKRPAEAAPLLGQAPRSA